MEQNVSIHNIHLYQCLFRELVGEILRISRVLPTGTPDNLRRR
jgi:hypothetical protein